MKAAKAFVFSATSVDKLNVISNSDGSQSPRGPDTTSLLRGGAGAGLISTVERLIS